MVRAFVEKNVGVHLELVVFAVVGVFLVIFHQFKCVQTSTFSSILIITAQYVFYIIICIDQYVISDVMCIDHYVFINLNMYKPVRFHLF